MVCVCKGVFYVERTDTIVTLTLVDRERFRAVLMTAATFILGVFPMVIATGAGASSRVSLGVPVFLGMLIGTCFGLLVIPLLYVLFQTLTERSGVWKKAHQEQMQRHD